MGLTMTTRMEQILIRKSFHLRDVIDDPGGFLACYQHL